MFSEDPRLPMENQWDDDSEAYVCEGAWERYMYEIRVYAPFDKVDVTSNDIFSELVSPI